MPRLARLLALILLTVGPGLAGAADAPREVVLWHSYRGGEEAALMKVVDAFEATHPAVRVRTLALPYDAFASKLSAAVPRGNGPDLFIYSHDRVGAWSGGGVVAPLDPATVPGGTGRFLPETLTALTYQGTLYGLPLAFKSPVLFYNKALISEPPKTTDELIALATGLSDPEHGKYGLAYQADNFYFHGAWLHGFGGRVFGEDGTPRLDTDAFLKSLDLVQDLVLRRRIVPQESTSALVTRLFNEGSVGMVINGPWFLGEIDPSVVFGIANLPTVSATGETARPFLSVEGIMLAQRAKNPEDALDFAAYLAGEGGATVRAIEGGQAVAFAPAYDDPRIGNDPVLAAFRAQLPETVPMDSRPEMQSVWDPANGALKAVLRGVAPADAADRAQTRLKSALREAPPARDPTAFMLVVGLLGLVASGAWAGRAIRAPRHPDGTFLARVKKGRTAYAYLAPAMIGLLLLVLVPFAAGVAIAFTHFSGGQYRHFVGLANFADILLGQSYGFTDPLSFYFTLGVTVLWTLANVVLHVFFGLLLAMLLKEPWLKLKGFYRAILIVPWAVPNYITALIWKGMFHKQFGAINALLALVGIEPVGWFSHFWTSFSANVVTNTWLGFPFMMVVALGALQSIPSELYEAAEVDGASWWHRFRYVTLPLLKPAMLPAVILGMVWTFNMFNIVYLVSGGEPDGSTDILISEAYRWAFQRGEQYGYAAAYATLIFGILVIYTLLTRKIGGAEELA